MITSQSVPVHLPFSALSRRLATDTDDVWAVHSEALERQQNGEDVILLSVGDPDFPTPPAITEHVKERITAGRTHYSPAAGEDVLRETIARLESRLTGNPFAKNRFVIFPGATAALYATFSCICDVGDQVIVPEPMYIGYRAIFKCLGVEIVPVPLELDSDCALNVQAVAAAITPKTRAVLVNTPGNPAGNIVPPDILRALSKLTLEHNLWLISDEVYSLITFDSPHISLLRSTDTLDNVVVIDGLSKSHAMTGWRIGWAATSEPMAAALTAFSGSTFFGCSQFIQDSAAFALAHDEPHVEMMRLEYQKRRDYMVERVDAIPSLGYIRPHAGMFMMLDVRKVANDGGEFARMLLRERGISVIPGNGFGKNTAGHVRVGLTQPVPVLAKAMDRLQELLGG